MSKIRQRSVNKELPRLWKRREYRSRYKIISSSPELSQTSGDRQTNNTSPQAFCYSTTALHASTWYYYHHDAVSLGLELSLPCGHVNDARSPEFPWYIELHYNWTWCFQYQRYISRTHYLFSVRSPASTVRVYCGLRDTFVSAFFPFHRT